MYFTRTNDTFRAWFIVLRGNGQLRTNILPGDFTATVVNSGDNAFVTASVTQSLQKLGLYRFDIPSSFLLTNGIGEYGVSVQVDTSTPPKVTNGFSEVLRVSEEDFDTISGSVWSTSSSQFNAPGSYGSRLNNIFSDTQQLVSGVNLTSSSVDTVVSGVWEANGVTFNVSGTMGWLQNQTFATSSLVYNEILNVSSSVSQVLSDTSDIIDDTTLIISGVNAILDDTSTIIDDTTNIENILASGSVNISSASINTVISGTWLANSGTFNVSGTMGYLQNQIGTTEISASVSVDEQAIADAVWSTLTSSQTTSGSFGEALGINFVTNIANAVWDEDLSVHSLTGSTGRALQQVATKVGEIYQILGLEIGSPLTVSQTARVVAAISQSISGDPNTSVTVTRTS